MLKGRDIVCLSFVTWDDHWGTPQQVMSRLARSNRVLYVDQAVSPLSFVTGIRSRAALARQLRRWRQGYREVAKNVYAAAPPPVLPLRSFKPVNAINGWILRRWLARTARRLGIREPIVVNFQPLSPHVASAVRPSHTVFYCVDQYAAVPIWWHSSAAAAAREAECCREAELVVCVGRALTEARRALNPNTHFVPNAADVAHFATARDPATAVPDDLARLPKPVAGYIGVVDFRFDAGLIAAAARDRPEWSFAVIGPVKGDARGLEPLRALRNVRFLGNKPVAQLPAYARGIDVCLIPYRVDEFTSHIFPLKLFEYLAAGKPIVASDLRELRPYEGTGVSIARTPDEFVSAIEAALAGESSERVAERQLLARSHTWDERVEQLSALIAALVSSRPASPLLVPEPARRAGRGAR
ncbi:MAG TPA: glycosyltransferase [Dehalococcoidia bacterium]|nr:glycosyltransferase [Dehalococcoidia bacterium]